MFDNLFKNITKKSIDSANMPASVMNRQQADKFIDLVVDESQLLKNVTVKRVDHPKGSMTRLDLPGIVSEGASASSAGKERRPDESVIEYDTEKYRSFFSIGSDFEEDNVEGSQARATILKMFQKAIRNDNEYAFINSDANLPTGDNATDEQKLLGVNDGIRKILLANVPAANILDAGGKNVSNDLFYAALNKIPTRYQVLEPDYKFLCSYSVYNRWLYKFSGRLTDGGDAALRSGLAPDAYGIPLMRIPRMPTNLGVTSNLTDIWLTPPSNLIWIVQRDIKVEFERKPREDKTEFTMHWRVDFQVANPDLVVYIKDINVNSATDYTAV